MAAEHPWPLLALWNYNPPEMPRYTERATVDPAGTVDAARLPVPLPYGLSPRDFFRTVEDVHDLLHDLNSLLHERQYDRLEELLDRAGFSGLISRTVASRLARASRALVVNQYHNGYPDLLVRGQYPGDAAQHGEGGLEIKASRNEVGWQSHGPRAGWFAVVQFELDERQGVATYDLEPTKVRAVMVAELTPEDWSWQPAREGRIRSGTASVRPRGTAKLRAGAVWIDPEYRERHNQLADAATQRALASDLPGLVLSVLPGTGESLSLGSLAGAIGPGLGTPEAAIRARIMAVLERLEREGRVRSVGSAGFAIVE